MKKILPVLLLTFSVYAFSQTYNFDFLTKYAIKNPAKELVSESTNYFNTDDFSYHLQLRRTQNSFVGIILDSGKKIAHRFAITEEKKEGEIRFQFKYENSFSYDTNSFKNLRAEIAEEQESEKKKFNLKIFPRKNSKTPAEEHEFTLIAANKNLFPIFRASMMHPYENIDSVNISGNHMVSKDVMKRGKLVCEFTLKEYKNVELELIVPEKLNRSKF